MSSNMLSQREAGRELGRLAFVEQELERQQTAGALGGAALAELRHLLQQRRAALYRGLMAHAGRMGAWPTVAALARAAMRRAPGDAEPHEHAAVAAMRQGDEQTARAELERAVGLGLRRYSALQALGEQYARAGRRTEALLACELALSVAPGLEEANAMRARIAGLTQQARAEAAAGTQARPLPPLADTAARLGYLRDFLIGSPGHRGEAMRAMQISAREQALAVPAPVPTSTPAVPNASPEPATAVAQTRPAPPPPPPPLRPAAPPRKPIDWAAFWSALFSERMLRALLYLGAALLVVSAFIWMAFNWSRFSAPVQLGALVGITATLYGCGWAVRSKLGLLRSGSTLIAIGAGWLAVVAWAVANVLGLGPPQTWLLVSALCVPAYIATTLWLREEIFSALSALAVISLLLAGLNRLDAGPALQACALVALMISYVRLAPALRSLPGGPRLAQPPVWIAQIVVPVALLGSALALRGGWLPGQLDQALLAGAWWLGAAHYLISLRVLGGVGYEQALAWTAPAALVLSAEAAGLPHAWHGLLLLATTPIYLWAAPGRARHYAATRRPWLRYRAAWPAYSTPYLLALLALFWPGADSPALLLASLGALALCAASARLFRHPIWSWLACAAGLLGWWHALTLLALASPAHWALALALGGAAFWLAGTALERAPRYGLAPLGVGYGMLTLGVSLALALPPPDQRLPLAAGVVVAAISAGLLLGERLSALHGLPLMGRASPAGRAAPFAAIAAALLPAWLLSLIPGAPAPLPSLTLAAVAALYLVGGQARLSPAGSAGGRERASPILRALGLLRGLRLAPRGAAQGGALQTLLTAAALGLSGLAMLAALPPAGTLVAALLTTWPAGALAGSARWLWRPRGSPWLRLPLRPADLLALAGGLAAVALALLRGPGDTAGGLALALIVSALYLLGARLRRDQAWLYLAGGGLSAAWLLGLRWLEIPAAQQWAWLAPAALLFAAAGLLARRRRDDLAAPGLLYGLGLAAASAGGILASYGGGALAGGLAQGSLALLALTALAAVATLALPASPLAWPAAALGGLAYLLTLGAAGVPAERYGLALAGLSTAYLGLSVTPALYREHGGRALSWLGPFAGALRGGFYALSAFSLAGAAFAWAAGGLDSAAQACLLLAAAYGLGAYLLLRPALVAVAAVLLAAGATAAFAAYLEPLAPSSARALLWLLLAWAYVGLARRLVRAPAAMRSPIYAAGFALAALACGWAVDDRPLLLAALGGLILLCLRWDRTLGAAELRLRRAGLGLSLGEGGPPLPIFLYPVAALTPLWLWLLLDSLGLPPAQLALGLAALAPAWLAVAHLVRGRAGASQPFLLICYGLLALTPQLAGHWAARALGGLAFANAGVYWLLAKGIAQPAVRFVLTGLLSPLLLALALANLGLTTVFGQPAPEIAAIFSLAVTTLAAAAWLRRRPALAIPAALTAPAAALLWLSPLGWSAEASSLTLLTLAAAGLGLSWLLERRGAAAYAGPADVAAAFCAILGLGLTPLVPAEATRLTLMLGGGLLFALSARRHRDPLWLYGAAAAGWLAYGAGLELAGAPAGWMGAALLPGVYLAFGLGRWLERRPWPPRATWRPALISPADGRAWGLPAYLAAFGGALWAVASSLAGPWPLAAALAGLAGLCGWAAAAWRARPWQWAALLVGQAAYLAALLALRGALSPSELSLAMLLAGLALALGGVLAEGRRGLDGRGAWGRLLTPSWAQGPYLLAAANAAAALLLALPPLGTAEATLTVGWGLALALALLATAWRDRGLALAAPALLALGADGLLRVAGAAPELRVLLLGGQGLAGWWAGQAARRWAGGRPLGQIWGGALGSWGHLASATALLWAAELGLEGAGTAPLSRALAIAGLLYVGQALVERRLRLSYLGAGMLVGAWALIALTAMPAQPQAYAIPAGLYLLAVGAGERWSGSPRRLAQLIELLGLSVLLGVSLWQSLPGDFGYGLLLGAEALLVIVWGALQRVRLLFFGGIGFFLANLAIQSVGPFQAADKALVAFAVGLVLVVVAVFVERRRDALREQARLIWAQLETWS